MYNRGVVSAVDVETHRVRVTMPSRGDLESPWLDVLVDDALDDQESSLPSIGAQVAFLLDESEAEGCVLGAAYSKVDQPSSPRSVDVRRWKMKDGAVFEYDRAAHKLTVNLPSGAELDVVVDGNVKVTASGDVEVHPGGLLKVDGAADFVAHAAKTDARLDALENHTGTHTHPTGVGPSGPAAPVSPGDSVACTKLKTS